MADGPFPALVQACEKYVNDHYSQARRWSPGYSDCSSFVGKGMKDLGQNPGGSTTLTYLASSKWYKISEGEAGAGDIAVNSAHMVLVTGNGSAIGQQNSRSNVRRGSVSELMSGTGPYIFKRYRGGSNITFAGYGTAQQAGISNIPESMIHTLEWLTDTTNWLRIGMVLAGTVLIYITIVGIGKNVGGGLLGQTAQKAGKNLTRKVTRRG